jgi:hypothetical protein
VIPFLQRLDAARHVLIAGVGGGFDVYAGMPIATYLRVRGCSIVFANLSFSSLWDCGGERLDPNTWLIDANAKELPYFPEKWLAEWLLRRSFEAPIYAFAKTGVEPLRAAYQTVLERHPVDLVILVDGGTDSLIFGDEPGLGTIVEDAVSVIAACDVAGDRCLLAALGFGVDHFHGVSHHSFLENVARLSRTGGNLGGITLVQGTPEGDAFLDLVDYANQRQPIHRSIVCNSIASALRGEFGDFQTTNRTSGTELFINPLMTQYWTFAAKRVVEHMEFASALSGTTTFAEASRKIEMHREWVEPRPRKQLPL